MLKMTTATFSMPKKETKEGGKTNYIAKSCGVLHVVTCREPAGLDQTPEAGSNTKGNITVDPLFSEDTRTVARPTNSKGDPNVN
jgi:hypothetical protein